MAHDDTAEDARFRAEVRDFLDEALPERLRAAPRTLLMKNVADQQEWHQILGRKGWSVPGWPVEYGGTGWTVRQRHIFDQELSLARAPMLSPQMNMIGPVIYTFGTQAQKNAHLPSIVSGERLWCQGYSEPGAGSDLSALRTRAVRDGDDYVINGQKIWTTFAHVAEWMFCLVRTSNEGKPQAGITFLLIDMKTPGIEVRPIISIDNLHHLNEVFFTDVRVPVENRIGEENAGWNYAKFLLKHERDNIGEIGTLMIHLQNLRKHVRRVEAAAPDLAPYMKRDLLELEAELLAIDALNARRVALAENGSEDPTFASMIKLRSSELQQRIFELGIDTLGPYVQASQTEKLGEADPERLVGPVGGPEAVTNHLYGRALTILGGTSEVQRNIIYKATEALYR
ncbi:acyl-CoA dehydrogenase family protein [Sphingobium chlorophenolicum]|nr:acyl-CoA dehydrogenase family protein [Sphingobium chlorophenolicum]